MPSLAARHVLLPQARRRLCALAMACYLQMLAVKPSCAEDHLSAKWQEYGEDAGRIRVVSKYVGVEKEINAQFALRLHGVYDSISGATPTGSSDNDPDAVPLSQLTDTRKAGVVDLDWIRGIHQTSFQYAHSKESDFLSRGFAVYNTSEYNKRNTGVSYGISFVDDDVHPSFFAEGRSKESKDVYVGVTQVIDSKTVARINFTYSDYEGYLSDPYKLILKNVEILPGLSLPLTFAENRPSERVRRIWFGNLRRAFDSVNGALDIDYRYFNDTWGIESHTFDLEWYQNIGERVILRPSYRMYQQNGAAFYYRDLNGTAIDPESASPQAGPFYSADYRLAKLNTQTWGLKAVIRIGEGFAVDASYERYEMEGEDGITPQAAFPDADIVTIGGTWWF